MDHYHVEVDAVTPTQWASLLKHFDDATLFQSWPYGDTMYGSRRLTHVVLRRGGQVVAAAEGRIAKLPYLKNGIVHFLWGPMWRGRGTTPQISDLQQIIRAIYLQYAVDKGFLVRIRSNEGICEQQWGAVTPLFKQEGYEISRRPHYTTIRVDLSRPLEDLRSRFSKSWKRHLRAAEKNHFSISAGTDDAHVERFKHVYGEMHQRKKLARYNPEIEKYLAMQGHLPDDSKMVAIICELAGEAVAANIVSVMGDTGLFLFGGSSNRAIKENLRGSYLLHWWTMGWLKGQGCRWYDLKGYDPQVYPGVSRFKAGTRGEVVQYLEYSACKSRLSKATVACGEGLLGLARQARVRVRRLKHQVTA